MSKHSVVWPRFKRSEKAFLRNLFEIFKVDIEAADNNKVNIEADNDNKTQKSVSVWPRMEFYGVKLVCVLR